ncbi:exosortase family protein XrtG [Lapidilactobacillus luobeiensis]|uniref:exosortase family protein XrtG n=1 Tax=Lapidilactobacillus luobeiensis TaxID=2950371 RepID=UPI0021C3C569|nr:exosortase family protein XrtG [Lapidilactobacillus luobeiensis]
MSGWLLFGVLAWLYGLSLLKRAHLPAFYFIWGSVGLFFILIALADPYWIWFQKQLVVRGAGGLGQTLKMAQVLPRLMLIEVVHGPTINFLSIDYECSGIIEMTAFWGLVAFYPSFSSQEKVFYGLGGALWIYCANVIRLLLVVTLVFFGGDAWFFAAHAIIGRLVFYLLVIVLYYHVFTYSQVSQGAYQAAQRFLAGGRS